MLDGFIVLGLIPGTQLQITFDAWIIISASIASFVWLWRSYRSELLQRLIITGEIIALTRRPLPEQFSL
jgi:hypothetical protein